MQKGERGSLGLNLRAFGLFIIVVKVLYFSCCKGLNKIIRVEPKLQILCNQPPVWICLQYWQCDCC
jgi:hypothetical protein